MRTRLLRAAGILAGALALIAASAEGGLVHWMLRSSTPQRGHLVAASLRSGVRILRDPFGVPHVRAGNRADAFLALGFVHAQDRFWQMEMLRRSAGGTLSELFGRSTVPVDRLARTLGLRHTAEEELRALSPGTTALLNSYSAGVNLYLARARRQPRLAPLELRWLGVEPAAWSPADTLALVRLRSWMLGRSLRATLLLDRLVRQIGGVASQDFFPVRPVDAAPNLMGSLLRLGRTADRLARMVGLQGRVGSLGFVVGASRSRSGLPILANDPHVELRLPPLFYAAHLSFDGRVLSGGTWPGIPVFWTGTNRRIAWGQVIAHMSVSDLFEETLDPDDPSRYNFEGRWHRMVRSREWIPVRGADPEPIELLRTRNGPLLRSAEPDDEVARSLSLRWTGQDRRSGIEALLHVQEAGGWDEFRHALRRFPGPVTTFLYADREGVIGSQLAGHLPVRAFETGLLPVPGGTRYYSWRGFVPFEEMPHRHGSGLPWLVASPYPEELESSVGVTWLWKSTGAADRLRELLAQVSRPGLREVLEIQRDRHSSRGVEAVQRLLQGAGTEQGHAARIRDMLLEWNGSTHARDPGASVYHVFRQQLASLLLEQVVDEPVAREITRAGEPLPGVLLARFVDRTGPRQRGPLVRRALERTWSQLTVRVSSNPHKWSWGKLHRLSLRHDFERMGRGTTAWLGRGLGRGPFPVPGDADSVWSMYQDAVPTTDGGVGPAFRYAVDLADADHARFGLAGGQSGHLGSPHYDDGIEAWRRGRPHLLWMNPGDIDDQQTGVWELEPAGPGVRGP